MAISRDPVRAARGIRAAVGAALALVTLAVFSPCCLQDFVNYDDEVYVTDNPHVLGGLTAENVVWAFRTSYASNWHPLTWLSLQLDAQVWRTNPFGYHLTNVLVHTANTVLLFAVLLRMTEALWRSAFVAALFGLHPLHVESVAWIAERKDVLSTFFGMLTLLAYARFIRQPGPRRYVAVLAGFTLSLMAKPMLVTLPCVLLLLDYWPLGRFGHDPAGRLLKQKLPLFSLAAVASLVTLTAQQAGGTVATADELAPDVRLANALTAYARYLAKTFWPRDLAVFYPFIPEQASAASAVGVVALLACVTALAFRFRRRCSYLVVGWLWFLGTLVPVIGLVQVGGQSMADRYTYFPLIGLFLMVVWAVADAAAAWHVPPAVAAAHGLVIVAACAAASVVQIGYWQDSQTLWEHTLEATRNNYLAHYNLGVTLKRQGNTAEAIRHYQRALELHPGYADAHNNLGVALAQTGEPALAAEQFRAALRLNPRKAGTYLNLGNVLSGDGSTKDKLEEALDCYRRAAALQPAVGQCYYEMGYVLQELGRVPEAQAAYHEALALDPRWPERANRAAWALATRAEPRRQNGLLALRLARQICEVTDDKQPDYLDTLAAAYAVVGRFNEAAATARRAAALMAADRSDRLKQVQERVRLYESGRPFRDNRGSGPKWDRPG
jgi:tetratricopeptide (TPR) repeat protein